MRSQKKQSEVI